MLMISSKYMHLDLLLQLRTNKGQWHRVCWWFLWPWTSRATREAQERGQVQQDEQQYVNQMWMILLLFKKKSYVMASFLWSYLDLTIFNQNYWYSCNVIILFCLSLTSSQRWKNNVLFIKPDAFNISPILFTRGHPGDWSSCISGY